MVLFVIHMKILWGGFYINILSLIFFSVPEFLLILRRRQEFLLPISEMRKLRHGTSLGPELKTELRCMPRLWLLPRHPCLLDLSFSLDPRWPPDRVGECGGPPLSVSDMRFCRRSLGDKSQSTVHCLALDPMDLSEEKRMCQKPTLPCRAT